MTNTLIMTWPQARAPCSRAAASKDEALHVACRPAGEALQKAVYEAVRAGPAWNATLFVLTYDEHGGFFDHVPPPSGAPRPDNYASYPDAGFAYSPAPSRAAMPRGTYHTIPACDLLQPDATCNLTHATQSVHDE